MRKYSRPPATLLALAGTMNGSPAVPRIASKGSLSPLPRLGVGAMVMLKPAGVTSFCSFSSQEPQEMKAALPWHQAVCDCMWSRPGEPSRMYLSLTIWYQASAAAFIASDFQAFGSRLSMASATDGPPNLIAVAITGQLM